MGIRNYHIGCTGWSLKDWAGRFYTDDAKPDDFLRQYATVFNAVEGNTSFYNIPSEKTLQKWAASTPDGFKFCFKFHRSITHEKLLKDTNDDILEFLEIFDSIKDRLGPFLVQLPPSFSPDYFNRLENTISALPSSYAYAIEVRHPDFYNQGPQERHLNQLLTSYNIDRVIFDTRKLHSMKADESSVRNAQQKKPNYPVRFNNTASRPLVRFVGSNDPVANESHLKEWAIVLADWIKKGLHPYFFPHSPDSVSQPQIALKFHRMLAELVDLDPMPAWPVDRQDEQMDLF